jgi:penicillin-binding protein 1C
VAIRGAAATASDAAGRRLFTPQTCFLVSSILSDENLRVAAFGYSNPLLVGFPMAIKTGTSSNWRDNWVIGYTDKYTVGVWAGDFRGNPMNQLSGAVGAGPLFNKIARLVVSEGPYRGAPLYPVVPDGVESIRVCKASGLAPTELCPETMTAFVLRDDPLPRCEVHRLVRIDKRNGLLASPKCSARWVDEKVFAFLPPRYAEWQKEAGVEPPPTHESPLSPLRGITANALVVTSPREGEIYIIEPGYSLRTQSLRLQGEVDPPLPGVDWLIDGKKVATAGWPYAAVWRLRKGRHSVQLSGGKAMSDKIFFEVR